MCESNIFGVRAVFGIDVYHIFPQSVLAVILLIGAVIGVVVPEPVLDVGREHLSVLWLSQPQLLE